VGQLIRDGERAKEIVGGQGGGQRKSTVSPPSYEASDSIFDFISSRVAMLGRRSITPALNRSGGKVSGAAAKSVSRCHRSWALVMS